METPRVDGIMYDYEDKSLHLQITPTFDKYGDFEIERVWEVLGDSDVIQIDEINGSAEHNMALSDGNDVYFITMDNWDELKHKGCTTLEFQGELKDFVDRGVRSHVNFMSWLGRDFE